MMEVVSLFWAALPGPEGLEARILEIVSKANKEQKGFKKKTTHVME